MSSPNGGIASDIATIAGDRLARRNALILAVAQALAGANGWVVFGTASIVGSVLGPDRSLATVPISTFIVGMWAGTLPTAAIARHYGRRTAFEVGAFCGILAGLLCTAAIVQNSFVLLCAGTMLGGFYASAQQSYRFAAADTASKVFKPKAIAWVLAGGVFGAVLGAQLIIFTKDLWTAHLFAASYLAQALIAALAAALLSFVRIPIPLAVGPTGAGRPLSEIMRQPRLIAAIVSGAMSYAMMNMVMTAAPLAMVNCSYSVTDANLGLQWHVIAMYAPSFFTGTLIARFGTERVVAVGLLLMASAAFVGLSGISLVS